MNQDPVKYWLAALIALFAAGSAGAEMQITLIQDDARSLASSSFTEMLDGETVTYGPEALLDGDIATAWVEGVDGLGVGESVLILVDGIVGEIQILNGFTKSMSLYERNGRPKRLSLSMVAGFTGPGMITETGHIQYSCIEEATDVELALMDIWSWQVPSRSEVPDMSAQDQWDFLEAAAIQFAEEYRVIFKKVLDDFGLSESQSPVDSDFLIKMLRNYGFYGIRFTIEDVYPGTHYEDTCISEISIETRPF